MSLFISVETRSNLLGSKAPNDTILIPVNRIHKIENFSEEDGCVITFGSDSGQIERVVSSTNVDSLLQTSVIDLVKYSV